MDKLVESSKNLLQKSSDFFVGAFTLDDIYEVFHRFSGGFLILLSFFGGNTQFKAVNMLKNIDLFSSQLITDLLKLFAIFIVTMNLSSLAVVVFNVSMNWVLKALRFIRNINTRKDAKRFNKVLVNVSVFILNLIVPKGSLYSKDKYKQNFIDEIQYLYSHRINKDIDKSKLLTKAPDDFYGVIKQFVISRFDMKGYTRLIGEGVFMKSVFVSSLILLFRFWKISNSLCVVLSIVAALISFRFIKGNMEHMMDFIFHTFSSKVLFDPREK